MASSTLLEMPTPLPDVLEEEPGLSHLAFTRLLEWLDDGVDSNGETYVEMRRRLISYFDRRDRPFADDLADQTLNRIGKTLEHDGAIATTPQARYCYVVARFVLLEDVRREHLHVRSHESQRNSAESWTGRGRTPVQDESRANREERLECLDRCLEELSAEQRALIVEYYRDVGRNKIERRRDMAKRLGITVNALGIRACRIRAGLEARMAAWCGER